MQDTPTTEEASFKQISDKVWQHLVERDWTNSKPRSLAISMALEANELLEHYQWQDEPVGTKEELGAELADVFIYGFQFARHYGIDIPTAITEKLRKSAEKYPVESFQGKSKEEQRRAWIEKKTTYTKNGL